MKLRFTKLKKIVDSVENRKVIHLTILILFFIAIFFSSIFIRNYLFGNNTLAGKEVYFNLNIARDIYNFKKDFIIERRAIQELIWPSIIAIFSRIFKISLEKSVLILSLLFGILSLILIYLILDRMEFKKRNLAITFFLISPTTVWLFSTFSKFIPAFFFSILSLYLLLINKEMLSLLFVAFTSFFGVESSIAVLIFSILGLKKESWRWFLKALWVSLIINALLFTIFIGVHKLSLEFNRIFLIFSPLSKFGVNVFSFLLAIIGIFATWKERKVRKRLFSIYVVFLVLLLFSIVNPNIVFFFNFILIFLASIGFIRLVERDWASNLIRNLTLGILILGLVLSVISVPTKIASLEPNMQIINALTFLKNEEYGRVLSVKENGFFIKYFSERESFIDEFKSRIMIGIENKTTMLFHERNLERLKKEFEKENVKYILLDQKTKQLFRTEDEGILLLLKHSEIFEKIYDKEGIEIWKFRS